MAQLVSVGGGHKAHLLTHGPEGERTLCDYRESEDWELTRVSDTEVSCAYCRYRIGLRIAQYERLLGRENATRGGPWPSSAGERPPYGAVA